MSLCRRGYCSLPCRLFSSSRLPVRVLPAITRDETGLTKRSTCRPAERPLRHQAGWPAPRLGRPERRPHARMARRQHDPEPYRDYNDRLAHLARTAHSDLRAGAGLVRDSNAYRVRGGVHRGWPVLFCCVGGRERLVHCVPTNLRYFCGACPLLRGCDHAEPCSVQFLSFSAISLRIALGIDYVPPTVCSGDGHPFSVMVDVQTSTFTEGTLKRPPRDAV
jgi:hypothetical protein